MTLRTMAVLVLCSSCGPSPVPQADVPTELAKALCARYFKCGAVKDEAACLRQSTDGLQLSTYEAQISAGKIIYDGAAARRCLDAFKVGECLTFSFDEYGSGDCDQVYTGQVKGGESCASTVECVKEDYCALTLTGSMCSGTCTLRVAEGGTADSSAQCAKDLVLYQGKCVAKLAEGAPCANTLPACDSSKGLYCNGELRCAKPQDVGQSCDMNSRCGPFYTCIAGQCAKALDVDASCAGPANSVGGTLCKIDLYCESGAKVCKAPGGQGATCTSDSACNDPFVCSKAVLAASGTCQPRATENQSCAETDCDSATYCALLTNVCTKRIAVGQPCGLGQQCVANSFCSGGTCKSLSCQ